MSTPFLHFFSFFSLFAKKKPLVIASEDLTSAWLASQLSLLQETLLTFSLFYPIMQPMFCYTTINN